MNINLYRMKHIPSFDNMDKNKFENYNHYLLWSGGYDSTLLTFYLLQLWKNREIKHKITLITCKGSSYMDQDKIKKENESKNKIRKLFKSYGFEYNEISMDININYKRDNHFRYADRNGHFQQYLFLTEASFLFKKKSIIHLGYIARDNNYYLNDVKNIMKSIDNLTNAETIVSIPLIHFKKFQVFEDLLYINKDLLKMVWTCENPINKGGKIEPCYQCNKCQELYNTLLEIKHSDKIKKDTKKLLNDICS